MNTTLKNWEMMKQEAGDKPSFQDKLPLLESLKPANLSTSKIKPNTHNPSSVFERKELIDLQPFNNVKKDFQTLLSSGTLVTKKVTIRRLRDYIKEGNKDDFKGAYDLLYSQLEFLKKIEDFKSISYLVISEAKLNSYIPKSEKQKYLDRSKEAVNALVSVINELGLVPDAIYRLRKVIVESPKSTRIEALKGAKEIIFQHEIYKVRSMMLDQLVDIVKFSGGFSRRKTLEYLLRIAADSSARNNGSDLKLHDTPNDFLKNIMSKNARNYLVTLFGVEMPDTMDILNELISIYESNQVHLSKLKPVCKEVLKLIESYNLASQEVKKMAKEALKRNSSFIKRAVLFIGSLLSPLIPKFVDYGFKLITKREFWIAVRNILVRYVPWL